MDPFTRAEMERRLHPGETPVEYRERIGHNPRDPRTWGPLEDNPNAFPDSVCCTHACGCQVVGNGTLPYPLTILWCDAHRAVTEPRGRLWWNADDEGELAAAKADLTRKGATWITEIRDGLDSTIGYVFEIPKAAAKAILGYVPDEEEWLVPDDAPQQPEPSPLCGYCGSADHRTESPAGDLCREEMQEDYRTSLKAAHLRGEHGPAYNVKECLLCPDAARMLGAIETRAAEFHPDTQRFLLTQRLLHADRSAPTTLAEAALNSLGPELDKMRNMSAVELEQAVLDKVRAPKNFDTHHLSGLAKTVAEAIYQFLVAETKRERMDDEPDSLPYAGCRAFWSPEEWLEKGEEYGRNAVLVLCHDGSDLGRYCSYDKCDYAAIERLSAHLAPLGCYVEQCTSWYSAVHKS